MPAKFHRIQYKHELAKIFNLWSDTRCNVNICLIDYCSIAALRDRPNKYGKVNNLPKSKKICFQYKDIYSQVLQECVSRVDRTFERFVKGDIKGKKSGRPRFKSASRYRSFTYLAIKPNCLEGKYINLPKLGLIKVILPRPMPAGFTVKTVTITGRPEGWFVNLSLRDSSVPQIVTDAKAEIICGIDVGLKEFLVTSDGESVAIPQLARHSEKRLKLLNKKLNRKKKKGTKNRAKAGNKLAKHYQKLARQRRNFHFKVAPKLLNKYDIVAYEDLKVKGLAKTRIAKSILDAGWTLFISILTFKAEKAGLLIVAVSTRNTTQNCSSCGIRMPKSLADRVHKCTCGLEVDRDWNAAINIKNLGAGHPLSNAFGVRRDTGTMKKEAPHTLLVS